MSNDTADLLKVSGMRQWIAPNEKTVFVKGKGEMPTYVLHSPGIVSIDDKTKLQLQVAVPKEKMDRLIDWNTETLGNLLREVLTRRKKTNRGFRSGTARSWDEVDEADVSTPGCNRVIEEVEEIIFLPKYDGAQVANEVLVSLSANVQKELRHLVSSIAELYNDNPFHNFEHASHVSMSVTKLMSRIVAPKQDEVATGAKNLESQLHDHTYGITSDPLTRLACAFSGTCPQSWKESCSSHVIVSHSRLSP